MAMQLGLDFSPPPVGVKRPSSTIRGRQFPPEVFSPEDIRSLIAACKDSDIGARHRALVMLLWRTGLRIAEALALTPSDLDRTAGTVYVRRGKGGHPRLAGADPAMFVELDRWLERRRARGIGDRSPVFCTLAGNPLDDSYVRHALRRLARDAGLNRRIHPHAFRHTHATELWREGVPEKLIQTQLGHRSLDTTDKYLRAIGSTRATIATVRARSAPNLYIKEEANAPVARPAPASPTSSTAATSTIE